MNSGDFSSRRGGTELGKRYMTRLNWIPHITGIPVVCVMLRMNCRFCVHTFRDFRTAAGKEKKTEKRKEKRGEEVMENAQCI